MLKTSGTTMKVFRCLKIPLTSMRVDCFESCKKIVLRFQASSIVPPPPPQPPDWSPNPLKETLLESVLNSFITVFIITKGWKINYQEPRF